MFGVKIIIVCLSFFPIFLESILDLLLDGATRLFETYDNMNLHYTHIDPHKHTHAQTQAQTDTCTTKTTYKSLHNLIYTTLYDERPGSRGVTS